MGPFYDIFPFHTKSNAQLFNVKINQQRMYLFILPPKKLKTSIVECLNKYYSVVIV